MSEGHYKLLAIIGAALIIIGIVTIMLPESKGIEIGSESSQGASTTASVRPYIDYKTADGRVLRVYLDTGEKYWVNPDGSLTPYGQVWVVPGTISQITQVKVGFDVTVTGKYLRDVDNDGNMEVTLTVTSWFDDNDTATNDYYYCFQNHQITLDIAASPSSASGGSASQNIDSGYKDIQTIYDTVWGGTPAAEAIYWPYYKAQVSVNATSVWNENLEDSGSASWDKNTIGSWQWKVSELSVSIGSASAGTQSMVNPLSYALPGVDKFTLGLITIVIGGLLVAVYVVKKEIF